MLFWFLLNTIIHYNNDPIKLTYYSISNYQSILLIFVQSFHVWCSNIENICIASMQLHEYYYDNITWYNNVLYILQIDRNVEELGNENNKRL